MKTDTITIDPTDLNLDCYVDPTELREIERQLAALSDRPGLLDLRSYCLAKSHGIRARQAGRIQLALVMEDNCDRIYRNLPEEYRW